MRESREREALREQARLMYVTLTRAKKQLVIPWGGAEFGKSGKGKSFAEILGSGGVGLVEALPECGESQRTEDLGLGTRDEGRIAEPRPLSQVPCPKSSVLPPLPARLLPHQLAHAQADAVRAARHEASADDFPAARDDDAIAYGLWWHETMQSLPWNADDTALTEYFEKSLGRAESLGAGGRGREELARLRASDALSELREARWAREAELPVFAPANAKGDAWIDGVMDFVAHDAAANEVRVVDWKTNRRRVNESDEALLARLAAEYAPQLRAYGWCAGQFFPGATVRLFVYSSAAGQAVEIALR